MSLAQPVQRRRGGLVGAIVIVAILLVAAIAAGFFIVRGDLKLPSAQPGEIFLEAAASPGANPFTDSVGPDPDPAIAQPTTTPAPAVTAAPALTQTGGATPGLYGGTLDNARCDSTQLVDFLTANPDKAAAWVAALNTDPSLGWGTAPLTVADIPRYVASLTSLILVSDTRVTNNGYAGGSATPFQAVLQAGTAVLVDRYGVPRARCLCGNPLSPPTPLPGTPVFAGNVWPGFDPGKITVVDANGTPVSSFSILVPPTPGGTIVVQVAAGCDPNQATCPAPGPTTGPASPTPQPTPSTSSAPTPTPTPTAPAAPPVAAGPPPGVACSPVTQGEPPIIELLASNTTTQAVDIYWLDSFCGVTYLDTVPAGQNFTWLNYENHVHYAVPAGAPSNTTPISTYVLVPGGQWDIQ